MSDIERIEKLIESNAKSIQALTDLANSMFNSPKFSNQSKLSTTFH